MSCITSMLQAFRTLAAVSFVSLLDLWCVAGARQKEVSEVDRTIDPNIREKLMNLKGWRGIDNPWMAMGDDMEEILYINLLVNPERYTGYKVLCVMSSINRVFQYADALE